MQTKTKVMLALTAFVVVVAVACGNDSNEPRVAFDNNASIAAKRNLEKDEMIARGQYLTTIAGCHDCHSPKVFGPQGMDLDSSRLFSGHPANSNLPAVDPQALKPGEWGQIAPDVTAFVGPWGISYAANLTPDSATGIGSWTEEMFIRALRTGKHLGQENGRPILPPMPWFLINKMTDEDLRSVYTYLRSLPPVNNRVPAPTPPDQAKLRKG